MPTVIPNNVLPFIHFTGLPEGTWHKIGTFPVHTGVWFTLRSNQNNSGAGVVEVRAGGGGAGEQAVLDLISWQEGNRLSAMQLSYNIAANKWEIFVQTNTFNGFVIGIQCRYHIDPHAPLAPATWFPTADVETATNVKASIDLSVPPATVVGEAPTSSVTMWAGVQGIPIGWLECNGAAVSRITYSILYTAVGDTYGAGDGSSTFNVPDLRGRFVRGLNTETTGSDPGRNLGSWQNDSTRRPRSAVFSGVSNTTGNHNHTFAITKSGSTNSGNDLGTRSDSGDTALNKPTTSSGNHSHTTTISSGGDLETRPENIALRYIIKV